MPNGIALTSEYAPTRSRSLMVMIMFNGFTLGSLVGGIIAAHQRAQGETVEHDHDHQRARTRRRVLRGQGDPVGHAAAETEAGQEAQDQQLVDVGGPGGGQGEQAEQDAGGDDHRPAAQPVGQGGDQQSPQHQPDQAGGEHWPELWRLKPPGLDQGGGGVADRLGVEPVQEHHRSAERDDQPLVAADRALVDQRGDVQGLGSHAALVSSRCGRVRARPSSSSLAAAPGCSPGGAAQAVRAARRVRGAGAGSTRTDCGVARWGPCSRA